MRPFLVRLHVRLPSIWRQRLCPVKSNVFRFAKVGARSLLRSRFARVLLPARNRIWPTLGSNSATGERAKQLERQLFGGFSSHALIALEGRHRDPDTSVQEFVAISRTLWRWHRMRGEHGQALQVLKSMARRDPQSAATYDFHLLSLPTMTDAGFANEAIETGIAAIAQFGDSTELEMLIAWAHLALGNEADGLAWFNRAFERQGLAKLRKQDPKRPLSLANLAADAARVTGHEDKLSVIIPAYNCATTLTYALTSIQQQTWTNLEIIVVDDCSSDHTWRVVQDFAASDARIVPLRNETNGGAYYCRNRGLRQATGDLITVHDSDDWSHPEKFAAQIANLYTKGTRCNVSMRTRVTADLRRGLVDRSNALEVDLPSLLLRKETLTLLGGWDEVRVGADRELFNRLAIAFQERPDQVHRDVPLAFGLVNPMSLTGNPFTGFTTLGYGARKEYKEAHHSWHQIEAGRRAPDFRLPRHPRPFPVPNIIRSARREVLSYRTILVSDFSSSNCKSLNLQIIRADGFSSGGAVMHWPCITNAQLPFDVSIRKTLIRFSIPTLVYGDHATCQRLLVSDPICLLHVPDRFAEIVADEAIILIDDGVSKNLIEANFSEVFGRRPCFVERANFTDQLLI
jgi:glycosyltransferase involved in cell wall biosynthesis